jgi:branched-chain amino acid transport system permease protein
VNFRGFFLSGGRGIKTDAVKIAVPLAAIFTLGPVVTGNQSILMELAVFVILADALNIVYGFTGYLPFGFGAFFAVGAYGTAIMIAHYSFPVGIALLVGTFLSCVLALVFTPLLRLSGAYFAIASLAAFEVLYLAIGNTSLTSITGGPYGISFIQAYSPNVDYAVTAAVAVVSALTVVLLARSYFGIALKAIREDRFAVELAGVNSLRYRNYAWLLSAFFSGLAGGLFGWYLGFFYPEAVFSLTDYSVLIIVFVLFGGRGTAFGPVIGAIILFAVYEVLILYFSNLLLIIFGLLLVLLILFIPDGIVPIIRKHYGGIS